ncbi:hypothetical protein AJ79_01341 [Helicocarpus griseus UAMH5409]|uniref:Uncharacterized protein n=1 Tax=Helicocarpus griseus UAMH5409 TaxID=1447875 RepID=A0A2B7Y841_9EURO|nr:hypothetical protein AJ79_01341 [Helicocarpus griseus UAMH5409]
MSSFFQRFNPFASISPAIIPGALSEPAQESRSGDATEPTAIIPNTPCYSPSPTDVGHVRGMLKSTKPALPTELADIILDYADYCVKDVVTFVPSSTFYISSRGPGKYGLLVKGPVIRKFEQDGPELRDLRIESVGFEIASHDQGWGGTYRCAFSWFEAMIFRRRGDFKAEQELPSDLNMGDNNITPADYSDAHRSSGWDFLRDEDGKELKWHVQNNRVSERTTHTHRILWVPDDEHRREEQTEDDGSGSGEGFVRALQPGDVIFLWARAMYPNWANYVEKAMIEVIYSD